ncbi:MAG: DUF4381 family protein [Verrucomicrobiaceae bacterium]|nr:MAG: DUF4381 family protein [Verrucomicrobiaceae bacterium]
MNGETTSLALQEEATPEALLPEHGMWPWWLAAAIIAVIIIAAVLVFRKRKPAAADVGKLREAAFREALAALAENGGDDVRGAAVQCSLVLRKYLAAAAADPALFETHEEFIARQDSLQSLTENARAAAASGFSRLAALKYGPQIPDTPAADVIAESRTMLENLHHGFVKK